VKLNLFDEIAFWPEYVSRWICYLIRFLCSKLLKAFEVTTTSTTTTSTTTTTTTTTTKLHPSEMCHKIYLFAMKP